MFCYSHCRVWGWLQAGRQRACLFTLSPRPQAAQIQCCFLEAYLGRLSHAQLSGGEAAAAANFPSGTGFLQGFPDVFVKLFFCPVTGSFHRRLG